MPLDAIQTIQEICHAIRMGGEEWLDLSSGTLLQQRCDVDPQRVVAHLDGLVESESLLIDVEAQVGEGPRIALEESGRLAAHKAVERGDALLAVQQQLDKARRQVLLAARGRRARWHRPDEQAADRIAMVQRLHKSPDLIAVPHEAALELRQHDNAGIDLVKDWADFHNVCVRVVE